MQNALALIGEISGCAGAKEFNRDANTPALHGMLTL